MSNAEKYAVHKCCQDCLVICPLEGEEPCYLYRTVKEAFDNGLRSKDVQSAN